MSNPIPSPQQPLTDPQNGVINNVWYKFLAAIAAVSTAVGGTVKSFTFNNGNGFTGTVTNPTTTPALSLQYTPPPTPGAAVTICILGDSLSAQNALLRDAWPQIFERNMNNSDAPCNVINLAIDACTFYRALQPTGYSGPANFVFGTNTPVQECIAQAPALVIVMLGFNDTITDVDSRSLAQVESDATATFLALRAGLPNAKIVYASELPYDNVNFTVTASTCNVQSKGVIPHLFHPLTSGITSGFFSSEALNNTLTSAANTMLETWFSLDATIKALNSAAGLDGFYTMWYWKIGRLGCVGPDRLHPVYAGCSLEAGYAQKALAATTTNLPYSNITFGPTIFPKMVNQNYGYWNDPDVIFSTVLAGPNSGTYNYQSLFYPGEAYILQDGQRQQIHPYDNSWFLNYKTQFILGPQNSVGACVVTNDLDGIFTWTCIGGPPNAQVAASIDGAAFVNLNQYTGFEGYASATSNGFAIGLGVGNHTIRYQIISNSGAIDSYGPFTFTVTNGSPATILAGLGGAAAAQPGWTVVTSWSNGWGSVGPPYSPVSYMKDTLGRVWLRGILDSGTLGLTAFNLPSSMWPAYTIAMASGGGGAFAAVSITTGGAVIPALGAAGQVSLDNLSFSTLG